jgi:hypothetical protein
METYRWWIDLFNACFFRNEPVIVNELRFKKLRIDTLGTYKVRFNDSKPRTRIYLNSIHVNSDISDTLQIIVHQMVHVYEVLYINQNKPRKTWYHSIVFRDTMERIGIISNAKGCHLALRDPFRFILQKHGIGFPNAREENGLLILHPRPKSSGSSKLRKWSCGCQNVRVGKAEFDATCDICLNKFELIS